MEFFRNWKQICSLTNDMLKMLVALATDEYVLKGLKQGFPELFSDQPTELLVPASALRQRSREKAMQDWPDSDEALKEDTEFWQLVVSEFDLPSIHLGENNRTVVPTEITEQLIGQKVAAGMHVSWHNERYLVVGLDCGEGRVLGQVIEYQPMEIEFIVLVPAKLIDLNS